MTKVRRDAQARSKTPVFDAFIEEAQRTKAEDLIDSEELGGRLAITDEERAAAQVRAERRLRQDQAEAEAGHASRRHDAAGEASGRATQEHASARKARLK